MEERRGGMWRRPKYEAELGQVPPVVTVLIKQLLLPLLIIIMVIMIIIMVIMFINIIKSIIQGLQYLFPP